VNPSPAATTVWIVDDDLGFVWWLGEVFTEAGCRTLPALSCEQALALFKSLDVGIDLLVVNPQLSGISKMLKILSRAHPNLKIVAIGNASAALLAASRPQASLERPSASESISRPEWLKKVRKLLKEVASAAAV
jgi:DNA-binding NtrC family response regulator